MSQEKRRTFRRRVGQRRYKKLFVIAAEGVKTEPQYFKWLNDQYTTMQIRPLKVGHDSAPPQVLKRMVDYLKREDLKNSDEAWLVVDKDQWTEEQLAQLHEWSLRKSNYGFALSNPKFEYWLLLHFEDGKGVAGSRECSDRLMRHLPNYDKGIDVRQITRERVADAIQRAKVRDNPPCTDWPRTTGSTTVYRLVENILKAQQAPHLDMA
ncbi:MAG: RloB domain-containing protein [Deltaproteobacteria bacterium]|nr:RloB domain-containing protein [Deltaproteobacteria bacterium]